MNHNLHPLLITGAHGNLGKELLKVFPDALGVGREELDITDRGRVFSFIEQVKPAAVIHAAALVDIVKCEREEDKAL